MASQRQPSNLPNSEYEEAYRLWEENREVCEEQLIEHNFPANFPGWAAFCEYCWQMFGSVPSGT